MAAAAARATVAARVAARSAEQNTMSCGSSPRSCFSYWAPCTFCSIASCRDEWWGNVVHLSFEKCDKSNRTRQHLERFTRKDSRGVFPVSEKECKRSPSALLFRETVQTQYHRFFIYARTTSSPMVPPPPPQPPTTHCVPYFPGPYARSLVCAGPAKPALPSLDPRPLFLRPRDMGPLPPGPRHWEVGHNECLQRSA